MDEKLTSEAREGLTLLRLGCMRMCAMMNGVLTKAGINLPQFNALCTVAEGDQMTMSTFSRNQGVTMGAGTNLIDKLVNAGLVSRLRSGSDRRVVKVSLTAAGVETVRRCTDVLIQFLSPIMQKLGADERRRFLESHRRVFEVMMEAVGRRKDELPFTR